MRRRIPRRSRSSRMASTYLRLVPVASRNEAGVRGPSRPAAVRRRPAPSRSIPRTPGRHRGGRSGPPRPARERLRADSRSIGQRRPGPAASPSTSSRSRRSMAATGPPPAARPSGRAPGSGRHRGPGGRRPEAGEEPVGDEAGTGGSTLVASAGASARGRRSSAPRDARGRWGRLPCRATSAHRLPPRPATIGPSTNAPGDPDRPGGRPSRSTGRQPLRSRDAVGATSA